MLGVGCWVLGVVGVCVLLVCVCVLLVCVCVCVCVVLCCVVLCCVVLCCAVLCCAVLCCAVLCCVVLCCVVLCCVVLCCVPWMHPAFLLSPHALPTLLTPPPPRSQLSPLGHHHRAVHPACAAAHAVHQCGRCASSPGRSQLPWGVPAWPRCNSAFTLCCDGESGSCLGQEALRGRPLAGWGGGGSSGGGTRQPLALKRGMLPWHQRAQFSGTLCLSVTGAAAATAAAAAGPPSGWTVTPQLNPDG